jgi:hypothetical protein
VIGRFGEIESSGRRGGALVFALVVVTCVTAIALGLLRVTHVATSRQRHAVDDKRAFYLAEAGLSQAYFGLGAGQSGQIGSMAAPALVGDGLAWVEATERDDGTLALRSTGLCGAGRSTLELVVKRHVEVPGVFADEGISVDVPILVDGYEPETPYYDQVRGGAISVDPAYPFLHVDADNKILFYGELFYRYYKVEGNDYYYDEVLDYRAHKLEGVEWDDFIDLEDYCIDLDEADFEELDLGAHPDFDDAEYERVLEYFASIPMAPPPAVPPTPTPLGASTRSDGVVGSNGPIDLSSSGTSLTIFGDAVPGVDQELSMGAGVIVTGATEARDQAVQLSPVRPPDVALLPAIEHDSAIPKVVPPGIVGYEAIRVAPESELVVQGPLSLVVGELELDPLSLMTVENAAGAVDLFVTQAASLAEESRIVVQEQDTGRLSLQGSAEASWLDLRARSQFHGTVYAPQSRVTVGRHFEVFGALVANSLSLEPGVRLHCNTGDDLGSTPLPQVMGWRIEEVPQQVRATRGSPEQILGVDKAELKPLADAGVMSSWHLTVGYFDHADQFVEYQGPFENFDHTDVKFYSFFPLPKLMPPDPDYTAAHGQWTITIEYKNVFNQTKTFSGTVAQFASSVMYQVAIVINQEIRHP